MEDEINLSWFTKRRINWAGADLNVLKRCPSEIPKYVGFGTTILITAILASISGGYAIYAISGNAFAPFIFGPLWGFVIFNLDSAIITSMRKPKIPTRAEIVLYDEKDINEERKIIKLKALRKELVIKQFYLFFTRFVVAVILGFIISMPIETLIFIKRINKKWGNDKEIENKRKFNESLKTNSQISTERQNVAKVASEEDNALYEKNPRLRILNSNNKDMTSLISENQNNRSKQQQVYNTNLRRHVDTLGKVSWRPNERAIAASRRIAFYNKQISFYESKIADNDKTRSDIITSLAPESDKIKENAAKEKHRLDSIAAEAAKRNLTTENFLKDYDHPDLIEQIETLGALKDKGSVMWTSILITLLFIIIEVAPVSVKFLTPRGTYDELLELDELERVSNERYVLHEKFSEISSKVKVEMAKAQKQEETEIDIYNKAMDDIAANRSRIIKELIKKSEDEQLSKIKGNKESSNSVI